MKNNGFTLLEVLISIGILVMVGAVAVGASTRAISVGTYSRDRTQAQDLARSQLEGLKAIRDTNLKSGKPWNEGLAACSSGYVKPGSNVFDCSGKPFSSSDYTIIVKLEEVRDDRNGDDSGGRLGTNKDNGYPSGLKEDKNMLKVTATVSWSESTLGGGDKEVKILSYISNDQTGK